MREDEEAEFKGAPLVTYVAVTRSGKWGDSKLKAYLGSPPPVMRRSHLRPYFISMNEVPKPMSDLIENVVYEFAYSHRGVLYYEAMGETEEECEACRVNTRCVFLTRAEQFVCIECIHLGYIAKNKLRLGLYPTHGEWKAYHIMHREEMLVEEIAVRETQEVAERYLKELTPLVPRDDRI